MRFPYMVNHNGTYYKAGEDVPIALPEMTDDIPDGALEKHSDGSSNVYDENNNFVGTADAETVEKASAQAMESLPVEERPKRGRPAKAE